MGALEGVAWIIHKILMTFPFPKGGIFIGDRVKGTIHVDVRMGMNDRKGWLKYERNNV